MNLDFELVYTLILCMYLDFKLVGDFLRSGAFDFPRRVHGIDSGRVLPSVGHHVQHIPIRQLATGLEVGSTLICMI